MSSSNEGIAPNAKRLLWAGFMAILAAGVGFSIRGGILGDWGIQFGFTQTELGQITGGGLVGFGIVILIGALLADIIGYGKLMILAFLCHFLSAALTLAATPLFASSGKGAAFQCLYWGMFLFAIGNGLAEAVVNPLVATLFPKNKTHFLNILHAGWPAGLIIGGLASFAMVGKVKWEIQMSLFLIPVVLYGLMCMGQRFPKSEASVHGVSFGSMLSEFAAPFLLLLLFIHAMVGYVELGTDSWISSITGGIMASKEKGLLLFVYTSALMFVLRFFAGPIVHRISPIGLLFVSACFGAIGLTLLSRADTVMLCVVAASVYGIGKTFLWPTMLGVVSERFPRGGAITIGAIGGVGMLSAGLLGGPGIGFKQDYFASADLKEKSAATYERYKADHENSFLTFKTVGLNSAKVGILADGGKELGRTTEVLAKEKRTDDNHEKLVAWWAGASASAATDKPLVDAAGLVGGKSALRVTAFVPMVMAVLYLLILIGFKAKGGYKAISLDEAKKA